MRPPGVSLLQLLELRQAFTQPLERLAEACLSDAGDGGDLSNIQFECIVERQD